MLWHFLNNNHPGSSMVRIAASLLVIVSALGLFVVGLRLPSDALALQVLVLFAAACLVFATLYFQLLDNLSCTFWGIAFGCGTLWAGVKTVDSIDFSQPFFLSFYWSTLGYFLLTVLCLGLCIGLMIGAAQKGSSV